MSVAGPAGRNPADLRRAGRRPELFEDDSLSWRRVFEHNRGEPRCRGTRTKAWCSGASTTSGRADHARGSPRFGTAPWWWISELPETRAIKAARRCRGGSLRSPPRALRGVQTARRQTIPAENIRRCWANRGSRLLRLAATKGGPGRGSRQLARCIAPGPPNDLDDWLALDPSFFLRYGGLPTWIRVSRCPEGDRNREAMRNRQPRGAWGVGCGCSVSRRGRRRQHPRSCG